jgi:ADP-ribose pyrophosphatase YjhB (NUDIX family)
MSHSDLAHGVGVTSAVAAIIEDAAGRVLLCQQNGGHRLWGLPGGKIRHAESPMHAVVRDIREETGMETDILDIVGIYQLTGNGCGEGLPDLLVYVFRGRLASGEPAVNAPGRICRLAWYEVDALPQPLTATTRTAIVDAVAGRAGVLREVQRDTEPEVPDAVDAFDDAPAETVAA